MKGTDGDEKRFKVKVKKNQEGGYSERALKGRASRWGEGLNTAETDKDFSFEMPGLRKSVSGRNMVNEMK